MDDDSVSTRVEHRLEEGVEVENVVMKWFRCELHAFVERPYSSNHVLVRLCFPLLLP